METEGFEMTGEEELRAFVERVVKKIHERYDAMREVVRRRGQDARDEQRQKDERE